MCLCKYLRACAAAAAAPCAPHICDIETHETTYGESAKRRNDAYAAAFAYSPSGDDDAVYSSNADALHFARSSDVECVVSVGKDSLMI